jgi:RimJ/RimL family protein N-acetyltransferase
VRTIKQMIIVCDEANLRSAAIPRRLGYELARVETRTPEAPGESGRTQIWTSDKKRRKATTAIR